MKNLKKFESFVNEELSPQTYRRAAKELEEKGQKDTADRMRSHVKDISDRDRAQGDKEREEKFAKMKEGKPQYDVEVNFNVKWGFNSEGEEVLFRETSRAIAPERRYELVRQDVWDNDDEKIQLENIRAVYSNGESVDNDFVMFWDAVDNPHGLRDFMVRVTVENGKLQLDHFNGKCASRKDVMKLAQFFELLYNNDTQRGEGYSFSTFIDDNFQNIPPDSVREIMDIRTFY